MNQIKKQVQKTETDNLNKNTVNYFENVIILTELVILEF